MSSSLWWVKHLLRWSSICRWKCRSDTNISKARPLRWVSKAFWVSSGSAEVAQGWIYLQVEFYVSQNAKWSAFCPPECFTSTEVKDFYWKTLAGWGSGKKFWTWAEEMQAQTPIQLWILLDDFTYSPSADPRGLPPSRRENKYPDPLIGTLFTRDVIYLHAIKSFGWLPVYLKCLLKAPVTFLLLGPLPPYLTGLSSC